MVLSAQPFFSNYTSTLLNSPVFHPFPHSYTLFLKNYRAHSYAAAGIIPVVKFNDAFQFRVDAYLFQPYQKIGTDDMNLPYYHGKLRYRNFTASGGLVYQTPVGPVSLSLHYYQKNGQKFYGMFNFGYIMFNQKAL